ncbi:MAG: HIT family protein [Caulobacter sp.]|nr:HIT family protein [Caulobacter sp.]
MSLDGQYDDANIFAKIVRGEVPSVKVFETDEVLAFMDAFPQSPGHCLVISKVSRARNLLDVEPEVLTVMMAAVQRLARAVEAALKPDGLVVNQYNGSPAGQTVFHLHFHVIPRWLDRPMGRHGSDMADVEVLKQQAAKITAALD